MKKILLAACLLTISAFATEIRSVTPRTQGGVVQGGYWEVAFDNGRNWTLSASKIVKWNSSTIIFTNGHGMCGFYTNNPNEIKSRYHFSEYNGTMPFNYAGDGFYIHQPSFHSCSDFGF